MSTSASLYLDKLSRAADLVATHNAQLPQDGSVELIVWDTVRGNLVRLGGSTNEGIASVRWEDLQECGLPRILARQVADIFRATDATPTKVLSANRLSMMPTADLVPHYNPALGQSNPVTERLLKDTQGQRCVVFRPDGSVNAEATTVLVKELLEGLPERTTFTADGRVAEVFPIGHVPDRFFDENPLFPGEPLRTGMVCPHTSRSWSTIPLFVRQLLHLAVAETDELSVEKPADAHAIWDWLSRSGDVGAEAGARCPRAAVKLANMPSPPALKIGITREKNGGKNDPFYKHKRT